MNLKLVEDLKNRFFKPPQAKDMNPAEHFLAIHMLEDYSSSVTLLVISHLESEHCNVSDSYMKLMCRVSACGKCLNLECAE